MITPDMVAGLASPDEVTQLQADTEAPTFVFHMNRKADMHPSDRLWIENTIRSQWAFTGTPLRLVMQVRVQLRGRHHVRVLGEPFPRAERHVVVAGRRARVCLVSCALLRGGDWSGTGAEETKSE